MIIHYQRVCPLSVLFPHLRSGCDILSPAADEPVFQRVVFPVLVCWTDSGPGVQGGRHDEQVIVGDINSKRESLSQVKGHIG